MTATIETLHKDGNEIYPTTVADAVVDEDNHTVQQRIDTGVYFLDGGTASVLQPWITNDMIINGVITGAKIADGTITNNKITDGTITNTKLNKKSATSVTHAGWAADKDKIPDMSFMAFWNGAYDGSNASNLQYFKAGSVVTNTLANEAVTSAKVKWSDFTNNTSYIKFGKVAICWGTKTWEITNQQAYGEANSGDIAFPVTYKTAPAVIASPNDMNGACGEYASTSGVSTTKFNIWGGHSAYTAQTSFTARWIAIGEIN